MGSTPTPELIRCPFCGKEDIQYGLALCASCHADIEYDTDFKGQDSWSAEEQDEIRVKLAEYMTLLEKANNASWLAATMMMKKIERLRVELETLENRANLNGELKLAEYQRNPKRIRMVTFTRGERSIDVKIPNPPSRASLHPVNQALKSIVARCKNSAVFVPTIAPEIDPEILSRLLSFGYVHHDPASGEYSLTSKGRERHDDVFLD